jgi:deferrochelatase/peroxidase EfeB
MDDQLLSTAYTLAKANDKAAWLAVCSALDAQFTDAGSDAVYQAAQRAIELHFAALGFGRRVWARTLSYEKAAQALRDQFPEFPDDTVTHALSEAYEETG